MPKFIVGVVIAVLIGLVLWAGTVKALTTFEVYQGGTGRSTFTSSELLYGNGTNALSSVATTSVSCGGTTSCTSFTAIGSSPVTITSTAAAFPFTTTTNYGALTNATGTPIWFQAGLQASSTSQIAYASTTALSSTGSSYFGTSGANVGIATTVPQNRLQIVNTSALNYTLGLESQNSGTNGAGIELYHNSVSPASSDVSYIDFAANNTSGVKKYFSSISVFPVTRTAGAEYGEYNLRVMRNGTLSTAYDFDATTNTTLIGANAVDATLNSNGSSDLILKGGSSAGATLVLQDGTSGHILASTTASGNFGIATTSPFAKLSVAGNSYLGGDLTATGTVTFTGLGTGLVKSTSGVLSIGSAGTDYVAGGTGAANQVTYFTGAGAIAGDSGFTYDATADRATLTYASTTSFTAGTATIGTLALTNPLTVPNGGTGTTTMRDQGVLFYNSSLGTVSQAANVNGNALNYDYTNGRLGIGTTTPGFELSVRGDAWFGGVNSPNRSLAIDDDGAGLFRASNNANQTAFTFRNGGITAATNGLNLLFQFSSTTGQTAGYFVNGARLSALTEDTYADSATALSGFGFDTGVNGTLTRVLTLTSGTNAGVGSSTPYAKLTVQNATANPTAIFEDSANDTTPVVIDTSGNLLVGTTSADYLGSKFIVWGSGGRYTEQNPNGRNRMVTNDNSLAPALSLINNQDGGSVGLQYQLGYGGTANIDGTSVTSARISSIPESTFTSDTTTQNAYLQFAGVVNGTLTTAAHIRGGATDGSREQLQLVSPREAITTGEVLATIGFISNDTNLTSPGTTTASVKAVATAAHTGATQPTRLDFATTEGGGTATSTTKMTLSDRGFVGIGTTSPQYQLSVASSTDGNIFQLYDSDGNCLQNPEAGAITTTCTSDEKLKENIRSSELSALDYFKGFKIRDYEVKASGDTVTGVIAQEVKETHPELVKDIPALVEQKVIVEGEESTILVPGATTEFVEIPSTWQLIKAIQELDARVTALEQQKRTAQGGAAGLGALSLIGAVAWAYTRKRE